MNTQMMIDKRYKTGEFCIISPNRTQIVAAQLADGDAVVELFLALHAYNASLDQHFALSDEWESLLREQFAETFENPDRLWLLVKDGDRAVGLLIAAVHSDSPLFRDRRWVEVEALYVTPNHRAMGIAHSLLDRTYAWADSLGIARVQLYVTASNLRARSIYAEQGFRTTQAIMRKTLG